VIGVGCNSGGWWFRLTPVRRSRLKAYPRNATKPLLLREKTCCSFCRRPFGPVGPASIVECGPSVVINEVPVLSATKPLSLIATPGLAVPVKIREKVYSAGKCQARTIQGHDNRKETYGCVHVGISS